MNYLQQFETEVLNTKRCCVENFQLLFVKWFLQHATDFVVHKVVIMYTLHRNEYHQILVFADLMSKPAQYVFLPNLWNGIRIFIIIK